MSWNTFSTVAHTVKALDDKKVSAVELATHYLDRADALQPALNAYITLDREKTLAEARVADEKRAAEAERQRQTEEVCSLALVQ